MALRKVVFDTTDNTLKYIEGTQLINVPINTIYTGDGSIQGGNRIVDLNGNQLAFAGVPEYTDNAAALAGNLHNWNMYFTDKDGDRMVKLVSEVT